MPGPRRPLTQSATTERNGGTPATGLTPRSISDERQEHVRSFNGEATYERLVAVKGRRDPEHVFCRNHIRPSRG